MPQKNFLKLSRASLFILAVGGAGGADAPGVIARAAESSAPDFTVKLETVMKHDDGQFLNPSTPKTELPPSTQLRKVVFGGSLI